LDSSHIQDQDAYFWNKRHPGQKIKPAYDDGDVEAAAKLLRPMAMAAAFEPLPGVLAHFHEAGHILGSAQISLKWTEDGQAKDLYFSGDLGQMGTPLLKDPFQPKRTPQTLLLESTYGDREHGDGSPILSALQEAIAPVLKRGGKVLIPSFAVGRTQELLYELAELLKEGRLPRVTVYVDSPLAEATTKLFRQHRELMDQDFDAGWRRQDPFSQGFLHFTSSKEDSQAINAHQGSCIILAASGMCGCCTTCSSCCRTPRIGCFLWAFRRRALWGAA
jgi:metallo-beta-lactamase family protein